MKDQVIKVGDTIYLKRDKTYDKSVGFDLSQVYSLSLKDKIIYLIHHTIKYINKTQNRNISIFNLDSIVSGEELTFKVLNQIYFNIEITDEHIRIHTEDGKRIFRFSKLAQNYTHYCKLSPSLDTSEDCIYFEKDTGLDDNLNIILNSIYSNEVFHGLENISFNFTLDLYKDIILKYYSNVKIKV